MDNPASHQGTERPETKNSEVFLPARRPKNSAGKKQMTRVIRTITQSTNCRWIALWFGIPMLLDGGSSGILQPHVDARGLPIVRFVQDIHFTVAVQVSDSGFMKSYPGGEDALTETTFAISKENPRGGLRVVRHFAILGPFGHLGGEDIQMPIAVDIGNLQAMSMNQITVDQLVSHPVLAGFGIAHTFVPTQPANAIAGGNNDLGAFPGLELAGGDTPADRSDRDGFELSATAVFEPNVTGQ